MMIRGNSLALNRGARVVCRRQRMDAPRVLLRCDGLVTCELAQPQPAKKYDVRKKKYESRIGPVMICFSIIHQIDS